MKRKASIATAAVFLAVLFGFFPASICPCRTGKYPQ